jgi:hypothetical protein
MAEGLPASKTDLELKVIMGPHEKVLALGTWVLRVVLSGVASTSSGMDH